METVRQRYSRLVSDPDAFDEESREAVKIDKDDVLDDITHHAEKYRVWAQLATIAQDYYFKWADELEKIKHECFRDARATLATKGERITEGRVEETASLMPVFLTAKESLGKAYTTWMLFRDMERSMLQRAEMIQSLNSRQRQEIYSYSISSPSKLDDVRKEYDQQHQ